VNRDIDLPMARGMQRNLREPYMRRKSRATSANPFLAWSDLSWKFGEMWMASAQVVAHRTARMAAAGPMPGSRDRREFALMGQEKVEAAAESALAIGAHLAAMNLEFGARAMRNAMTDGAAWMSLATSRSVSELMSRQLHVAQALTRSMNTASAFAASTARLGGRGLKPIHARAKANARRLARG
jgi:hypothetical protein